MVLEGGARGGLGRWDTIGDSGQISINDESRLMDFLRLLADLLRRASPCIVGHNVENSEGFLLNYLLVGHWVFMNKTGLPRMC